MQSDPQHPQDAAPQAVDKATSAPHHQRKKRREQAWYVWPIKAIILSLVLTALFAVVTEVTMRDPSIAVSVVILVVLVVIGVLFDMVGVAVASCDIVPLAAMASRKVKGARTALRLCQRANIVSSVCNDIIGDSLGIIAGACGAALAYALAGDLTGWARIAVTIAVSSVIAALTIGGKACMKQFALKHDTAVVLRVGRILSIVVKEKRK